jgi:retinol-binding protein 3
MMSSSLISSAAFLISALAPSTTSLQGPRRPEPDMPITAETRAEVIDNVIRELKQSYVFPKVADDIETALRTRMKDKEYDHIESSNAFATTLTEHLQAVSHDKHMRLRYHAEPTPKDDGGDNHGPSPAEIEEMRAHGRAVNFGFERVERLAGNVGYLDLRGFQPPMFAGETAAAAMSFLANTDALIIDLRKNGGGAPEMVQLMCSYLFEGETVHLNDLYFRPKDETRQFWTLPYVPGKRYGEKDVYVLTSHYTFSGAEEFTYNLKNLKRATIVGETTGGGANPGGPERVGEHFELFVPSGRAINPITKTNWEGTGIEPDIKVVEADALSTAHAMALEKIVAKTTDAPRKEALQEALANLKKDAREARSAR